MQIPIQVTFRGMDPSEAVDRRIRDKAGKLEQVYSPIMGCRVVVEQSHRRHHKGNVYHIRIDLTVPGKELVVSREGTDGGAHEDVYVAIRDAFAALRRQLEQHAQRERGHEKHHEVPTHGRVESLSREQGRGVIRGSDGRELVFSRNSVVDGDFDRLKAGDEVRYAEALDSETPAASTVHIIGKHHLVG